MPVFFIVSIISFFLWVVILVLPWQPWRTNESWEPVEYKFEDGTLRDLTILIPARNEAVVIKDTISSTARQAPEAHIIVIDDNSEDQTAHYAAQAGTNVMVLEGKERPTGWSGKLWALEQGRKHIQTDTVMLLDADIKLKEGAVAGLYHQLHNSPFSFLSLMSKPSLTGFWNKLLMPAFIYFFKLLYPFKLSNAASSSVAAAAGGCIIMKREVLEKIDGFNSIKDTLIDDCALARKVKEHGFRTWLGLSHSAQSRRPYNGFSELWNMVARTAYTQLNYSVFLLFICTILMILLFWIPVAGLFILFGYAVAIPACAFLLLMVTLIPILRYYNLNAGWSVLLPVTATLFLAMTWSSAFRYWKGERMRWRGRIVKEEIE